MDKISTEEIRKELEIFSTEQKREKYKLVAITFSEHEPWKNTKTSIHAQT
jgi:hypothetical protein